MYQKDRHFDPHQEFAKKIFGTEDPTKKQRQLTKIANFGFPAGLSPKKFVAYAKSWGVKTTIDEGKRLRKAWFDQWPEMDKYFSVVRSIIGDANYGIQKIPQSGFVRMGVGYTDCANGFFQTLASHGCKEAFWEVCRKCYLEIESALFDSRPVNFLHDEIITETPKDRIENAKKELENTMIEAMEKCTPDVPSMAKAKVVERWVKDTTNNIL
jgi:DNA polymerase-1